MGAIDIPELQYSPIDDIQSRISDLRKSFAEHKTRDVEFRLVQLRKLYWAYVSLSLFQSRPFSLSKNTLLTYSTHLVSKTMKTESPKPAVRTSTNPSSRP